MMMVNLAHSPAAVLRSAEIMADAYDMPEIPLPGRPPGNSRS